MLLIATYNMEYLAQAVQVDLVDKEVQVVWEVLAAALTMVI